MEKAKKFVKSTAELVVDCDSGARIRRQTAFEACVVSCHMCGYATASRQALMSCVLRGEFFVGPHCLPLSFSFSV